MQWHGCTGTCHLYRTTAVAAPAGGLCQPQLLLFVHHLWWRQRITSNSCTPHAAAAAAPCKLVSLTATRHTPQHLFYCGSSCASRCPVPPSSGGGPQPNSCTQHMQHPAACSCCYLWIMPALLDTKEHYQLQPQLRAAATTPASAEAFARHTLLSI